MYVFLAMEGKSLSSLRGKVLKMLHARGSEASFLTTEQCPYDCIARLLDFPYKHTWITFNVILSVLEVILLALLVFFLYITAVRWRGRVKECICERGATREERLDQAKRECLDRERCRLFCCGTPLERAKRQSYR